MSGAAFGRGLRIIGLRMIARIIKTDVCVIAEAENKIRAFFLRCWMLKKVYFVS